MCHRHSTHLVQFPQEPRQHCPHLQVGEGTEALQPKPKATEADIVVQAVYSRSLCEQTVGEQRPGHLSIQSGSSQSVRQSIRETSDKQLPKARL